MKHGKLSLFLTASSAVMLVGCGATTPPPAPVKPITVVPKKPKVELIKPSGYVKPYGPSNAAGSDELLVPVGIFSSEHDGNAPDQIADGDLQTRWSSNGKKSWIVLDYGKSAEFNAARLAFYKGDLRISQFDIEVSEDGRGWTKVITGGESSGKTDGYERFPFVTVKAQFVKFIGYGNTSNTWNSISELNIVNCKINTCLESELINSEVQKEVK
ncbi:discoidin domain-containing protein [Psychromonas sp.]|nr:discoidin domain-containing protein [Psychromonas sp.]